MSRSLTIRTAGAGTSNDNAWACTGSIGTTRSNVIEDTLSCNCSLRCQPCVKAASCTSCKLRCCDSRVAEA